MENVFLDTTVLFNDPFFKSNYNSLLLRLAEVEEITLFVSEIVLSELKNNYEKQLIKLSSDLRRIFRDWNSISLEEKKPRVIKVEKQLAQFERFYEKQIEEETITLIKYSNDLLPILIDRSIKRIKPFSEKKDEFRDCIIWLSYVQYAKDQELQDCYLITSNVKDFYDEAKTNLHPELKRDSEQFSVLKTSNEFFEKEDRLEYYTEVDKDHETKKWLKSQHLNEENILTIILENFEDIIEDQVSVFIASLELADVIGTPVIGYLGNAFVNKHSLYRYYERVVGKKALISGGGISLCTVELYEYLSAHEEDDSKYRYIGEEDIDVKYTFSFYYSMKKVASKFEIHDMALIRGGE